MNNKISKLVKEHTAFAAYVYGGEFWNADEFGISLEVRDGHGDSVGLSVSIAETEQIIEILKQAIKRAKKREKKNAKKEGK